MEMENDDLDFMEDNYSSANVNDTTTQDNSDSTLKEEYQFEE
jgi:hypothetical protein